MADDYLIQMESEDEGEEYGVDGMTLQLIELLTTLVQRPNVQEVIRESLAPLTATISSYMILEAKKEGEYVGDFNFYI